MADPRAASDTARRFASGAVSGARLEYEALASSILAATDAAPVDEVAKRAALLLEHRPDLVTLTADFKNAARQDPDSRKHEYRRIGEAAGDLVARLRAMRRTLPKGWKRFTPLM